MKKVLVVKLCCIGDIIQATPALRALKAAGCEVHFLCTEWVKDLVDMIPFADKKWVINPKSITGLFKIIFNLRREKYDLIVNFHRDSKSCLFAAVLGAKRKAGFNWKGQGVFLNDKFIFDEKQHESLRYLSIVEGLGFERKGVNTEIKAPERKNLSQNRGKLKAGIFPGGGVNPGTKMFTKRWPAVNFAELSRKLEKKGFEIYFFGSESDRDALKEASRFTPGAQMVKTATLKELASCIADMDVFVAGDTGPLHMSAALGVKTIGLFGPTSADLVGPLGENTVNIWGKTQCSPCYEPGTVHYGEFKKCRDNFCMKEITVGKVEQIILDLFDSGLKTQGPS